MRERRAAIYRLRNTRQSVRQAVHGARVRIVEVRDHSEIGYNLILKFLNNGRPFDH